MLSLSELSTPEFWQKYSNEIEGECRFPLIVVFPSGRHESAHIGQLALISDSLYTHEVILEIDKLARKSGLAGVSVRSMLDIDYYEEFLRSDKNKEIIDNNPVNVHNANLLILATADINIVTFKLLDQFKSFDKYQCGYAKPYEHCILFGAKIDPNNKSRRKEYNDRTYPYVGVLGLYEVPWTQQQRIAFFSGGILATGTLAGTFLLLKYLRGEENKNNRYSPEIPLKIVSATPREYMLSELMPVQECMPRHDLRNIDENIDLDIHE